MPQVIKEFLFVNRGRKTGSKYMKYLDGRIWKLIEGTDYLCKDGKERKKCVQNIRTSLHRVASKHNMRVHVNVVDDGIVIQAYKKDGKVSKKEKEHSQNENNAAQPSSDGSVPAAED